LNNYIGGMPAPTLTRSQAIKARRFDSQEQEAYLHLWRTYDRLRLEEDRLFESVGLTAQQYNALRLLRGTHPGSLATLALAERLVSRAPDITRLLDKLESRKLIRRDRPAGNRRVVEVRVTEAGLKLLQTLDEPVRRCHARQLGHMSPARLRQLIALLREARRPHEAADGAWAETTS
jgi:DNA-binding MarR family transcriptional regulator